MIVWNLFIVLLAIIGASINNRSYASFFDDGMNGIGISLFLVAWSLIWFGIGYYFRKDFILKKNYYKEQAKSLGDNDFEKEFKSYYVAKYAKMFTIVFASAIPWYVIGYVRESLALRDFMIILPLMFLSAGCYWLFKLKSKSSDIA
ncbi:hypothetical protein EII33_11915 [Bacteroides heparinolyticus]|nr:hypothetical protein [Bacteroides heparinolyticus]RRD88608.1 hypothetical protein EII33_11915 [Bacteroides heparinolyticus]